MSKRDIAFLSIGASVDLEPRTKRRKESQSEEKEDGSMADATKPAGEEGVKTESGADGAARGDVKEQGLALWQTVKDAVNKECVTGNYKLSLGQLLSHEFMRLPSKRQYPDYYQLIRRPISLDEIKKQLDEGSYKLLEEIKDDLVHCFTNAKKYNQKNSSIWLDAKVLHKLTKREYLKMTGIKEEDPTDGGAEDGDKIGGEKGDADGAGDGVKKAKVPNLYRQLKGRLQKLIDKTDDDGRVLSTLFMELPLKKDYPTYYKEIKKPQSFENIFKHLKRKEYHTSAEFATEVELVFSNAFAFNQEHSPVWEDAMVLRDYFRHLMSDLPTPFALPEYAKPVRGSNKIKLKMSGANQTASSPHASGVQPSFTLRVPGGTEPSKPAATVNPKVAQRSPMMGAAAVLPAHSTSYANQLPVAPMTAQTYPIQPIPATPRQPQTYQYAQHHYPNASYQPQTSVPSSSQVTTSALPHIEALSYTRSPSPSNLHPLKGVSLVTKPRGRPFKLDYRDGVKSWAMRLGQGEGSISIADVRFLAAEEEEQGSEDEAAEEEEEDTEEEPAPRNGKGKAKRGRGRPKAITRATAAKTKATRSTKTAAPPKASTPLQDSVKILLNGSVVEVKEDREGEWDMELRLGQNVLEVGEEGGMVWKVYMERVAPI